MSDLPGKAELQVREVVPGREVRHVGEEGAYAIGDGEVFFRPAGDAGWVPAGSPRVSRWRSLLGRWSPTRRLLRLGLQDLLVTHAGTKLTFGGSAVHRCEAGSRTFRRVHVIRRGRRPLPSGFLQSSTGELYLGEYWPNRRREEVRLWKSEDDGREWRPVHTFGPGDIRHIHAVQEDPFSGDLWITTGDVDDECWIVRSTDGGRSFGRVGGGGQQWRAVSLLFTERFVYWGTDDPKGDNWIVRWNRADGDLDRVGRVRGPVYYSTTVGDRLLFATTVEGGGGDQDGYARIYGVGPGEEAAVLARFSKDWWHPVLFGYGIIRFARTTSNRATSDFWVNLRGLEGGNRSVRYSLEANRGRLGP